MPVPVTEVDVQRLAAEVERRLAQVIAGNAPDDATALAAQSALERYARAEITTAQRDQRRQEELRQYGLRGKGSADEVAVWVAVGDEGTCESCDARAGEENTMRTWNVMGIPGSANLVCGSRCRCYLVPEEWVGGEEDEE